MIAVVGDAGARAAPGCPRREPAPAAEPGAGGRAGAGSRSRNRRPRRAGGSRPPAPPPTSRAAAEAPRAARAAARRPGRAPPGSDGANRLLSPVVRRLVNEHGLDPSDIPGTGPGGRITRDDVVEPHRARRRRRGRARSGGGAPRRRARTGAGARRGAGPPRPPPPRRAPPAAPAAAARASATRRSSSPRSAADRRPHGDVAGHHPHAFSVVEVDYANVDRVRNAVKEEWKGAEGFSLTYLPFISRAIDRRPRRVPAPQRQRRRRRADRAQVRRPRHRRRPRLPGPARAGRPRRRHQAAPGPRPGDRRPRHPGQEPAAVARRDPGRHVHHLQQRLGRLGAHRGRSSTSPRWPSCRPTPSSAGRSWSTSRRRRGGHRHPLRSATWP